LSAQETNREQREKKGEKRANWTKNGPIQGRDAQAANARKCASAVGFLGDKKANRCGLAIEWMVVQSGTGFKLVISAPG
jgi:hypothetical protein